MLSNMIIPNVCLFKKSTTLSLVKNEEVFEVLSLNKEIDFISNKIILVFERYSDSKINCRISRKIKGRTMYLSDLQSTNNPLVFKGIINKVDLLILKFSENKNILKIFWYENYFSNGINRQFQKIQ